MTDGSLARREKSARKGSDMEAEARWQIRDDLTVPQTARRISPDQTARFLPPPWPPLCDSMKSAMRGWISERKREPLNTP